MNNVSNPVRLSASMGIILFVSFALLFMYRKLEQDQTFLYIMLACMALLSFAYGVSLWQALKATRRTRLKGLLLIKAALILCCWIWHGVMGSFTI